MAPAACRPLRLQAEADVAFGDGRRAPALRQAARDLAVDQGARGVLRRLPSTDEVLPGR